MIRQYELVDMVRAYDPNLDEALLNRADDCGMDWRII